MFVALAAGSTDLTKGSTAAAAANAPTVPPAAKTWRREGEGALFDSLLINFSCLARVQPRERFGNHPSISAQRKPAFNSGSPVLHNDNLSCSKNKLSGWTINARIAPPRHLPT